MSFHKIHEHLTPIYGDYSDSDTELSNHVKIIVYILTQDEDELSDEVISLSRLFRDELFIVQPRNIPIPVGMNNNTDQSIQQSAEAYRIIKCLKDARKKYHSLNVLIIKDNCITVARRKSITNICLSACNIHDWDICYLTKWLDRCDLHSDRRKIPDETATLARSKSPHGIQALMFSPSGRDILIGKKTMRNKNMFPLITKSLDVVLNDVIEKEYILAYCVNPNVFTFNTSYIKSITDLAKLSECRRPEDSDYLDKNILSLNWYIFAILCTVLLTLIIWMVDRKKMG